MSDEAPREASGSGAHRYSRNLADKILIVFHYACDQTDFEIAGQLLQVVELMLKRPHTADTHRRSRDSLVAAHQRLWHLQHPGDKQLSSCDISRPGGRTAGSDTGQEACGGWWLAAGMA